MAARPRLSMAQLIAIAAAADDPPREKAPIIGAQAVGLVITAQVFEPIVGAQALSVTITAEEQGAGDVTSPTLLSAAFNTAGTELTLTYNELLNDTSEPATTAWSLGGTASTVATRNVTDSTVVLGMNAPVFWDETITVSYTAPGANDVKDLAGNLAGNLTNHAVTNNTVARWDDILYIFGGTPHWFLSGDNGVTHTSNVVSNWNDSTAANKDATPNSGPGSPIYNATGLNGHGTVEFTKASGHYLEFDTWDPPAPGTTPIYFHGVFKPKSYTSGDNLYSCSSTTILRCRMSATSNTIGAANPTAGPVVTFTPGNWYIHEQLFDNANDYTRVGNQTSTPAGTTGNNNGGNGTFRINTDAATRFGDIDWAYLIALPFNPTGAQKTRAAAWVTAYYGGSVGV